MLFGIWLKLNLSDVQRDLQRMELSDSSSIASSDSIENTYPTNDVDELMLFRVISTSGSNVESVDSELVRELERQIDDVVEESIESMCKGWSGNQLESFDSDHDFQFVEVAWTKQTVRKQPTGLPRVTVGGMASNPPSGGTPTGRGGPPTSGGGGSVLLASGGGGPPPAKFLRQPIPMA